MTSYLRGRRFEWRVRDYLTMLGYFVVRSAGSRGPVDLVALRRGRVLLVQCRARGRGVPPELRDLAARLGAEAVLARKEGRRLELVHLKPPRG